MIDEGEARVLCVLREAICFYCSYSKIYAGLHSQVAKLL